MFDTPRLQNERPGADPLRVLEMSRKGNGKIKNYGSI